MNTQKSNHTVSTFVVAVFALAGFVPTGIASLVTLQQPTATFSQNFGGANYSVSKAIDGITNDDRGWAVAPDPFTSTIPSQTAVFETSVDVGFVSGSLITFSILQAHSNPGHNLGRFRLSVTTDNRSLFADGLDNGGDVTANWTVLNPSGFVSANGATLTKLGDFSILASGANPSPDTYTITAPTTLTGITGIRLEALEDPSLPYNGPGRFGENGNFVVSELTMDIAAVPEPSSIALLAIGSIALAAYHRSRRS